MSTFAVLLRIVPFIAMLLLNRAEKEKIKKEITKAVKEGIKAGIKEIRDRDAKPVIPKPHWNAGGSNDTSRAPV